MKLFMIANFMLLLLISCSDATKPDANYDDEYDMVSEMDIKSAIVQTNMWRSTQPEITSYINSEELVIVFPDDRKVIIPQPDNEMYIAIAPYVNETHSCETHYISGCQAELKSRSLLISANTENGQILAKTLQSLNNGFIEVWLPKETEITITINYNGKIAEEKISTFEGDRTCITTMQLK